MSPVSAAPGALRLARRIDDGGRGLNDRVRIVDRACRVVFGHVEKERATRSGRTVQGEDALDFCLTS